MTIAATTVEAADAPRPAKNWSRGGGRRGGGWGHTVVGVLILGVMLFPVYWMLNVSLQPSGSAVGTPWLPLHVSFGGYAKALQDQSGHLATSLVIATGRVVLSLLIADPGRVRPLPLAHPGRQHRAARHPDQPDDPGHRRGQRSVQRVQRPGAAELLSGSDPGGLDRGHPVRDPHPARLHVRHARAGGRGRLGRRGRADPHARLRRAPHARNALVTAGLFTFLFTWGDFLFALTLTTTEDVRPSRSACTRTSART